MKKFLSVRKILTLLLVLSTIFAGFATYYTIAYWGFSFTPKEKTAVWTVDAHITFAPTNEKIEVSLSTPRISKEYKILSEDVVATGYEVVKDEKNHRMNMKSLARKVKQDIYYRIMLYDNEDVSGKIVEEKAITVKKLQFNDEQQEGMYKDIWQLTEEIEVTRAEKIIKLIK